MFAVSVDLRRFDRMAENFTIQFADGMRESALEAAQTGAKYARAVHPHKRRTGKLTSDANCYAYLLRSGRNGAAAEIINTTPYARYVEYPTRPHMIRPKAGHGFIGPLRRGQSRRASTDIGTHRVALRWYVGGRAVFARAVRHPGTPGFPFMRPAGHRAGRFLGQYLRDRIRLLARTVWKN
jgi:hypothetical protein